MTIQVVEVSRVTPAPGSANSLTIPLTFFDLPWLVFNPVTRLFFYELSESSSREHFHSFIVPKPPSPSPTSSETTSLSPAASHGTQTSPNLASSSLETTPSP